MTQGIRGVLSAVAMVAMLGACGGDSEQEAIVQARAALDKRDVKSATILLKNTLQKHPDSAQARFLFGKMLLETGNAPGAEVELRKAQELKHPTEEVAPLLARILLLKRQPAKVIEEYANLTLTDSNRQADLSAAVATAYATSGQRDKAVALVDTVLARAPDHVPTRLIQARLVAGGGDVDGALKLLDAALAREANNLEALRLRGDLLLFGARDRTAAVAAYRKVLETQTDDLHAHSQLIGVFLAAGDKKAATAQYETLAKLYPALPQVQLLGAQVALLNGEPARAKEIAEKLMRLTQDKPSVLVIAATAAFELNSLTLAETHLNKVLASHPNSAPARRLMAMVRMRSGEPAKALEVLRPLLDSPKPDGASLSLAAEAYLAVGDAKRAEAFFSSVAKLRPGDVKARTALALAQMDKGDREAALAELQSIAGADKGTFADMALINVRLRQRDLDGALSAIDALERKLPQSPSPADLRGRILLLKRDNADARKSFELALKRDPVYFPSVATLAAMDVSDRKPDLAAQRYEAVLNTDPKNVQALVALAGLKARANASPAEVARLLGQAIEARPGEPATHVLLVDHWLRQSNPEKALTAAQAGQAANPDSPALLDALGRAQLANGQVVQAIATFGKLALDQPKSALAQVSLANAHLRAKNPKAAEAALRKALEMSPDLQVAQRGLILLATQAKQPEKALQVARTIQKQHPKDAIGHLVEGSVYASFKDWDASVKAYRAGLEKQGIGTGAAQLYATLVTAKRQPEAERFADEWARKNPKEVPLRSYRAMDAIKSGNLALAERLYGELVAIDSGDLTAINNLALLMAKNKTPGAVAMAERALALSPEDPSLLDTLAFTLAEDGQLARAIETQRTAVQRAPSVAAIRLNMAKLHLRAKDKKSAKAELDELAKLGATFAGQQEVKDLLANLAP